MKRFFEENSERVHIMSPLNGEYTLCGDAFDGFQDEMEGTAKTEKRIVTCRDCIKIIDLCRGIKTKREGM